MTDKMPEELTLNSQEKELVAAARDGSTCDLRKKNITVKG